MTSKQYWKFKFGEPPKTDADKLACAMMAEYHRHERQQLIEELKRSRRIWDHLMNALQWLDDNNGGIGYWVKNQKDVIEARIKCNKTALRDAGVES